MTEPSGIRARLSQAAAWADGRLRGEDVTFTGVCSDSRALAAGNLFVALGGPNHDGHDYVAVAAERGAAAALVERPVAGVLPQIVVDAARTALGRLAAGWRQALGTPLVAVTGSNGKTTVKEMLAAILGQVGPTLATAGNLNNDIGVPLTLLRLDAGHRFGVIEMGANHPNEIAYLTGLARPQVAIVNNAGSAHLEGFGSLEGVARAKGEIYGGLAARGTAVINADDGYADVWKQLAGTRPRLTFGLNGAADVRASYRTDNVGSDLTVTTPNGTFACRLPLLGSHNVRNALAAIAGALALGVGHEAMAAGLSGLKPVRGRLAPRQAPNGAVVIDDSYNANPASLRAGIDVLAACAGRRLLILGDMAELGDDAAALHAASGEAARVAGIDGLYAVGPLSHNAVTAFGEGGIHFDSQAALIEALRHQLAPGVTVLVKGSRSARMERVADALCGGED